MLVFRFNSVFGALYWFIIFSSLAELMIIFLRNNKRQQKEKNKNGLPDLCLVALGGTQTTFLITKSPAVARIADRTGCQ